MKKELSTKEKIIWVICAAAFFGLWIYGFYHL